jgi:hypothetical protein
VITSTQTSSRKFGRIAGAVAIATCTLALVLGGNADAKNKYVGAKKCKKCHDGKDKGGQHAVWKKMKHANAYKVLASADAKKVAKKAGVADPQKDAKCLKCHETAFGESKKNLARSFKPQLGVQCESCHGAGEKHFKIRFREEQEREEDGGGWDDDGGGGDILAELPPGELAKVSEKMCKACHNKDSPTFKAFDYAERCKEVSHLDPRHGKKRKKKPCAK